MSPLAAGIFSVIAMVAYAAIDIFLAKDSIPGNTWSELIRSWAEASIFIPWLSGVLNGHWFHWMTRGEPFDLTGMIVTASLSVAVIITGVLLRKYVDELPLWIYMVTLQAGILTGALGWRV